MYPIKERQYSRETIVIRRIDEPQMNTKYISKTPDSSGNRKSVIIITKILI